jgi:hypothetical protein
MDQPLTAVTPCAATSNRLEHNRTIRRASRHKPQPESVSEFTDSQVVWWICLQVAQHLHFQIESRMGVSS